MKVKNPLSGLSAMMKNKGVGIIPVKVIEDDVIQTNDGLFKAILKVTDPINTDLMSEKLLEKAVQSIRNVLNLLEVGQSLQILISSERIDITQYLQYLDSRIHKLNPENFEDKAMIQRLNGMKAFLQKNSVESKNVKNFYIILESSQDEQAAKDELNHLCREVRTLLRSSKIGVKRLEKEEIQKILYDKLSPCSSLESPYIPGMNLLEWQPHSIRDLEGKYFETDDTYYAFYTLAYIANQVPASWLSRALHAPIDLDISINLRCADKGKVISSTSDKILDLETELAGNLSPEYRQHYENERKSLWKLLERLSGSGENIFDTSFVFSVHSPTLEQLKKDEKKLKNALSGNTLRPRRLDYEDEDIIWYLLPIGYLNRDLHSRICWSLPAESVGAILPFDSQHYNDNKGVLIGFTKDNSPVIYDPYDPKFNNRNHCIMGEPGSGKSFAARLRIGREIACGIVDRIFVIDPENEYRMPNAQVIEFRLGSDFVTNPFHIRSTVLDGDGSDPEERVPVSKYLPRKIDDMMSFFRWIVPDMSPEENSLLVQAIEGCYSDYGLHIKNIDFGLVQTKDQYSLPKVFPTLSDLEKRLEKEPRLERVKTVLQPFINGAYSQMFNGQTNWSMENKITVFDISELSQQVQKPLMDLLLKELWEEIKKDRNERKGLYVDEAWLLADAKNPQTLDFMRGIAKRIRKYGGYLTTITQNVADFFAVGEYGRVIYNASKFKTFFLMSEDDVNALSRIERLSEKEYELLGDEKEKGNGIHLIGSTKLEIQVKATDDEIEYYNLQTEREQVNG
jgi:conjugal transfer ATP-binding protein TraC